MTIVGDAYVRIRPDDEGFEKEAGSRVGGAVKRIALMAGGIFAAQKIFSFGKASIDAARESIAIGKQTEAVIKSTGGAAGLTAQQIFDMADALSAKNTVDDEAIKKGQNLLLTFTNIKDEVGEGNDIFTQSSQIMIDMAAALGTDVAGGAMQLGKALQDPVAGVAALTRVGIQFTAEQKEMIKTLVESGDTVGAQKIILGELETQFGGSAAAIATDSDRLALRMNDLKEVIGRGLVPIIDKVAGWFADFLPAAIETTGEVFEALKPTLSTIWDIFTTIIGVLREVGEVAVEVAGFFLEHWDKVKVPILAVASVIAVSLIPRMVMAGVTAIASAVQQVAAWVMAQTAAIASSAVAMTQMALQGARWVWLGVTAMTQAAVIAAAWLLSLGPIAIVVAAVVAAVVLIIANWDKVKGAVAAVFNWVKDNWPLILAIITGPIGLAVLAVVTHWDTIKEAFTKVKDWIGDRIGDIVAFIKGLPDKIAAVAGRLREAFMAPFKAAFNGIAGLWNNTVGKLRFEIPGWVPGIGGNGFSMPTIPTFHAGGVVPGFPGQEVLALLRSGERILPPGPAPAAAVIAPSFMIEQHFGPGTNADDVREAMSEVAQTEISIALEGVVERALAGRT